MVDIGISPPCGPTKFFSCMIRGLQMLTIVMSKEDIASDQPTSKISFVGLSLGIFWRSLKNSSLEILAFFLRMVSPASFLSRLVISATLDSYSSSILSRSFLATVIKNCMVSSFSLPEDISAPICMGCKRPATSISRALSGVSVSASLCISAIWAIILASFGGASTPMEVFFEGIF
eukprot:XP_001704269.1 Hypothetical protein GL50803_20137 [Giardia lamblia ATCC 50803]